MLHLGPVVVRDVWRDVRVGHQALDARRSEDVGRVSLQRLVMPHHAVLDFARRTQLRVRHPVDDAIAETLIQVAAAARCVAQVTHEVLEVQVWEEVLVVPTALAVSPDDEWSDISIVPRFIAGVLHKLILEGRNEALERISHDEKLEVSV